MNGSLNAGLSRQSAVERAAECLKDHPYTVLADIDQLKAWRCKAPGTNCYTFDILITRFGTATLGDIDELTFSVGLSFGIEFLASDEIGYYIHSKLEQNCRERELDEDGYDFWDSLSDRLYEADHVEQASLLMSNQHEELGLGRGYWIAIDSHAIA